MTDISQTIAPKSDQLNADDLIAGPRTIKVSRVAKMGEADQPIAVYFEGDGGKPYKPCKSMRRVLVQIWGSDGAGYVGRRMTLYRDDKVQFGGMAVGGIRISHMSGIASATTMPITEKRASRKPFTVRPLEEEQPSGHDADLEALIAAGEAAAADGMVAIGEWGATLTKEEKRILGRERIDDLKRKAQPEGTEA